MAKTHNVKAGGVTFSFSLGRVQVTKRSPKPTWHKRLKSRGRQALAFIGGWLIDKVVSWGLDDLWEATLEALRPIFGRWCQPKQT